MKTINVLVRDKIASTVGDIVYICGNSDYVVSFDFDEEWAVYDIKTARFVHNGTYTDVVFTGNQCAMPVIHKAYGIYVGVYAGDLRTTTPAHIPSAASILSAEGTPAAPPEDVYAQITALCNEAVSEAKSVREDADAGKFDGAPGKTPVPGVDYFTPEDKQAIAAEAAQKVGFPQPTSADNGKYLGCEGGKAAWLPVEASGGGEKIVFNETVLASGTIPEGLEEWKAFFEGVITVAELKKWKKFLLVVVAGTSTNIQIFVYNHVENISVFTSGLAKQHYIEFEWLDSERTVQDIRSITGDAGIVIRDDTGYYAKQGVYLPTVMSNTSFRTSINKKIIVESYNNYKLKLVSNTAQTADGAWTLHGLLQ